MDNALAPAPPPRQPFHLHQETLDHDQDLPLTRYHLVRLVTERARRADRVIRS